MLEHEHILRYLTEELDDLISSTKDFSIKTLLRAFLPYFVDSHLDKRQVPRCWDYSDFEEDLMSYIGLRLKRAHPDEKSD